ncbi:RICIN domain-containing protein [Kitasatospora sp. NA04385]|uniref:RICIN domain-containing protein n=1 Tax=Kitasatospora sp. NA04385 TaxID=2742135 RepID=UPI0015923B44|nr:RICIN domain-containing protein [Kitasatospora sp. NA04385]QKW18011.1 RICIN domain-containing protein [Kitasatospora sp. NA04385]
MRRIWLLVTALLLSFLPTLIGTGSAQAAAVNVTNGTQFTTTDGSPLHAHGGGLIKVGQYYYFFGAELNADNTFKYVNAYRSTDLKTWEFRNHVLGQQSAPELQSAVLERPKVIYNSTTGKYVLWVHKENGQDYSQARAAVAVSDTVDGDYSWQGSFRPLDYMSRDMTLYKDADGTAYLISAANENADLQFYRLSADYLTVQSKVANPWPGQYREAPAVFKRGDVYFMLSSTTSGWYPNQQMYATAPSVTGPWTDLKPVGDNIAYDSQTTYVQEVQGTSTTSYLYLGDRWGPAHGMAVNASPYVWLPLRFPTSTTMTMSWYPQVAIDTATGSVEGVGGGPYYTFTARHSGKCLTVPENNSANGIQADQWTCIGALNQQWRVEDAGSGYVRVIAQHSGRCLNVSGASTANNAPIIQWDCVGATNEQWKLEDVGSGYYRLIARHSGKCLNVDGASTANSARLIQYTCVGASNEQFARTAS